MGRKGVSKRKPKKSSPVSGSSNTDSGGGSSPVQALVKDKGAPLSQSGKPQVRSGNIHKKR
jgi:hypothetical protein